jgi:hypothetical protein
VSTDLREKAFDHAWRYFELHAAQRMTVFNFFLILAGLVAAGIGTALQASPKLSILAAVLGILLAFLAFIFWKLDQRVCFLTKSAERAMAATESSLPTYCQLFLNEPVQTKTARAEGNPWTRPWTYGRSFRVTFWTTGLFGIGAAIVATLRFLCVLEW